MEKIKIISPIVGILMLITAICFSIFGWGLNIYKLCKLDFEPSYKAEIIRVLAIPTGLGFIVGYVEFEEEKENK